MLRQRRVILTGFLMWIFWILLKYLDEPSIRQNRVLLLDENNKVMSSLYNCQTSPCANGIKVYNKYWQKLETSDGSAFYLYNAYLDKRSQVTNSTLVRILVIRNHVKQQNYNYNCRIEFDDGLKYETKDVKIQPIVFKYTYWQSSLVTCKIEQNFKYLLPKSVSLIEDLYIPASNVIKIYNNNLENEIKKDYAICLRTLEFPEYDFSIYLIEWFELMIMQGVDQIFMYEYSVHPGISKVLDFYINKGILEVTPFALPPNIISDLSEKAFNTSNSTLKDGMEYIPMNDCLYKNINRFKFIAVIDIDEIIVPRTKYKLSDMVMELKNESRVKYPSDFFSAYSFNRYSSMYESNKSLRAMPYFDGEKSILDTELAVAAGNQRPSICNSECENDVLHSLVGHVRHFGSICKSKLNYSYLFCNINSVEDDSMHKYRQDLTLHVTRALDECLGIREYKIS